MKLLEPPDSHHLSAAEGWLGLGNHPEANAELEKIAPALRSHPDVLQIRWQIYAQAEKWAVCLDIASAIVKLAPERFFGWLHRSISLHKLNRTHEAVENLVDASNHHDIKNTTVAYYMACFECRLGRIESSRQWLEKALELTSGKEQADQLKLKALDEPDLEPLWKNEKG